MRIDARGMRCPWPVIRLARAMREVDEVYLVADDPKTDNEVRALAETQGWTVVSQDGAFIVRRV